VPVLVVALLATVIVLVTFAVTTLVEEPSTIVAIIAVLVLSIGADIGWKHSRDAHVTIS
jgi:predicted tellurium resistance membrane protein TerC